MKGIFLIIILLAMLTAGYLVYERVQNPKDEGEAKNLLDMPNMIKEKMDAFKEDAEDRYQELNDMN